MIVVRTFGTADNTDVLNGTDLGSIPTPGILSVYGVSTQNDTNISITGPGSEPVIRTRALPLRASAEVRQNEDPAMMVGVSQGGRYIINVDVVTAATFQVLAIFLDLEDLAGLSGR